MTEDNVDSFKKARRFALALRRHAFDYRRLDAEIRKTKSLIRQKFGSDSYFINDLKEIQEDFPQDALELHEPSYNCDLESRQWSIASLKLGNLIQSMIDETETSKNKLTISKEPEIKTHSIFIVHGQDLQPVKELKLILEKIGIEPIVLYDQPSKGLTIIEKLEEYSKVDFAFVLLTPDDLGLSKEGLRESYKDRMKKINPSNEEIENFLKETVDKNPLILYYNLLMLLKDKARQNVILEFGYFIGRLGRSRVCCLYKGDLELPSDMHGICYLRFEKSVAEVKKLILQELKEAQLLP